MANAKISDDSVFVPQTDIRVIDGIPGYEGTSNVKITGPALVTSIINSNSSGDASTNTDARVTFYGTGGDNLGGSGGLIWQNTTYTLNIGIGSMQSGLNGGLVINGNYIGGSDQPKITFKFGDTTNSPSTFIVTTQSDGEDQTWLLPKELPTAGQVLSAEPNGDDVTLEWVDHGTSNNNTITLAAGTGLTGGGDFTLNQNSNETITFNATGGGGTSKGIINGAADEIGASSSIAQNPKQVSWSYPTVSTSAYGPCMSVPIDMTVTNISIKWQNTNAPIIPADPAGVVDWQIGKLTNPSGVSDTQNGTVNYTNIVSLTALTINNSDSGTNFYKTWSGTAAFSAGDILVLLHSNPASSWTGTGNTSGDVVVSMAVEYP
jgi:hypothetical protein